MAISKNRKLEIENPKISRTYRQKIDGCSNKKELELFLVEEPQAEYKTELNLNNHTTKLNIHIQNGSVQKTFGE